jgi:hypothetical protein
LPLSSSLIMINTGPSQNMLYLGGEKSPGT